MVVLDKGKIVDFMQKRKDVLYDHIIRDFCGGLGDRLHAHNELKYWKEAIERGEFDKEQHNEIYIILSNDQPEIVDFTFYTSRDMASNRVDELNSIAKKRSYWYVTLYNNLRERVL